jgi:hypothetical protein
MKIGIHLQFLHLFGWTPSCNGVTEGERQNLNDVRLLQCVDF